MHFLRLGISWMRKRHAINPAIMTSIQFSKTTKTGTNEAASSSASEGMRMGTSPSCSPSIDGKEDNCSGIHCVNGCQLYILKWADKQGTTWLDACHFCPQAFVTTVPTLLQYNLIYSLRVLPPTMNLTSTR
jgi:hypothetical protein